MSCTLGRVLFLVQVSFLEFGLLFLSQRLPELLELGHSDVEEPHDIDHGVLLIAKHAFDFTQIYHLLYTDQTAADSTSTRSKLAWKALVV